MKKIRSILIVIAIVFLAVNTAYAWGRPHSKPKIFKELNLTEEQEKRIEENRAEQRKKQEALSESIKEERENLREALKDPSITKEKVEPIAQKIKSLQAEMVDNRIDAIFAAKSVMTPDQYARFNKMMEDRKIGKLDRLKRWRYNKKQ